ncbi:transmembrane protein 131 [Caerostris extrusa]|uniref:Transmembrane protein 131 n=1 Tax=Caerostris extrusa TaxID=172846 RepID=A0AAV4YDD0_CAEEX|nr:transmembrane protein 131 [Caerostris extrusa]
MNGVGGGSRQSHNEKRKFEKVDLVSIVQWIKDRDSWRFHLKVKISTQSLYVHSSFSHSMTITGISAVPEDSRLTFDPLKQGTPVLHPNSKIWKYCKQKCYSGLPTTSSMGHQWLLGMALPSDVSETDGELFRTLSKRWHSIIDLEEKITNITLRIDTTEVRGYLLKAHVSLQWPRMLSKCRLRFPVTLIGNNSVKDFTLENPSSLPVLVQLVPLSLYPNPTNIINALKDKYGEDFGVPNIVKDSEVFSLEDLEDNNKCVFLFSNTSEEQYNALEKFFVDYKTLLQCLTFRILKPEFVIFSSGLTLRDHKRCSQL